jgi:hypothetical protein
VLADPEEREHEVVAKDLHVADACAAEPLNLDIEFEAGGLATVRSRWQSKKAQELSLLWARTSFVGYVAPKSRSPLALLFRNHPQVLVKLHCLKNRLSLG